MLDLAQMLSLRQREKIEPTLIVVAYVSLLLIRRGILSDGVVRYNALASLLRDGQIPTTKFSVIGPLFSAPLWYLGQLYADPEFWLTAYTWLILGIGLNWICRLLRKFVDAGVVRQFALIVLCASMFPYQVKHYFGEPFTAMGVAVSALLVVTSGPLAAWWTWIPAVLGVANTPGTIVALGLMALKQSFDTRRVRYFLVPPIALALIMTESWIRRGSPFLLGYPNDHGYVTYLPYSGRPGFSYPMFFGVMSILFSFGKGVFYFVPGLFLPVRHLLQNESLRRIYGLWFAFIVGLLLLYSKWWAWDGSEFWGPRFFLIATIPASLTLALRLKSPRSHWDAALTLGVLALSTWVAISGVTFNQDNLELCAQNNSSLEALCKYAPEFSALTRPFVVRRAMNSRDLYFISLYLGVFAYLGGPLFRRVWGALRDWVKGLPGVNEVRW
jgi:hypothetical protein